MSAALPDDDTLALTGLDRALVAFLQEMQPSADPLHGELAARVSHQFGLGHACLDLRTLPAALRQSAATLPWVEGANSPLVLSGERLYLRRNWDAEQNIRASLAARKRFTLITGGPGTGKTTTVVRLLALLQADPARQQVPLRIALAAPTGKAAARLGESIASALQK